MFIPHFPEELSVKNEAYCKYLLDYFKVNLDYDGSSELSAFSAGSVPYIARVKAKQDGILAGLEEVTYLLKELENIDIKSDLVDGDSFKKGDILLSFEIDSDGIGFKYERLILNLLSRLCGISVSTSEYADLLDSFENKVGLLSTRKVLLGPLDKKSFVVGGGYSHRLNQGQALMFKKYHKNLFGLDGLIEMIKGEDLSKYKFVEFELHSREEAEKLFGDFPALDIPVGVMFDNFAPVDLRGLLQALSDADLLKCDFVEASGGICLANLKKYDMPHLDFVSVGEITKNSQAVDLSFDLERR